MARSLGEELNELKIRDNISKSEIILYYRTPTSEEQGAYTNQCVQRIRNKVVNKTGGTRMKFGSKILAGFRDGDFTIPKDGKIVAISSDEKSENFYPGWKDLILKKASDLIEVLAMHVFESPVQVDDDDDSEDVEVEDVTKNL